MALAEYTLLVVVVAALGTLVLRTAGPIEQESQLVVRRPATDDRVLPDLAGSNRRPAFTVRTPARTAMLPAPTGGLGVAGVGRGESRLQPGGPRRPESRLIETSGLLVPPTGQVPASIPQVAAPLPPLASAPVAPALPAFQRSAAGKLVAFTVVVPMERLDGRRARLSLTLE